MSAKYTADGCRGYGIVCFGCDRSISPLGGATVVQRSESTMSLVGTEQWDGLLLTIRHRNVPD